MSAGLLSCLLVAEDSPLDCAGAARRCHALATAAVGFGAVGFGAVAMALVALSGCAGSREGGFESPVPGARLEAIEATARTYRATRVVPDEATREHLVECLHADDPLVRFMAIGTLTDITGDSKGYRHDAPESIRELAIPAWVAWAKSQPVSAPPEPSP